MKYFLPLLMIFGLTQSFAQCNSTEDKMLLIGDSWAFFSWTGDSYNENFNRFGFSDLSCYSTTGLAVNGAEANDYFSDANRKQELIDYVSTHPELEIVHLSLGGNDAMASWNKNMTDAQEDAILSVIMNDIKEIIDTIWFYNPDLDIHISGYDYSNFDETVGTALFPTLHPFYGTWDNMGQPVAAEVNSILAKATQVFADSAAAWDQVSFVNNLGLMQWTYGQTTALSVAPFGTYQPLTAPVPGGFTDYPSPLDALNFGGMDSFHLNNNSYELFIKRHFEEFYWAYFRNADQTFIADDSLNNGWTTSTIFGDDKLELGNDGTSNQIQTILSFNTSDMPNLMKASSASIFIKRTGLTGSNLQPENLYVSIKAGNFGDDIQLDANDFNDFGDEIILQELGTEGQGTILSSKKQYKLNQFAIPLGIGIKFNLKKRLAISLEYGIRKTFTDYLDDVSGKYVSPVALAELRGPLAAQLADPSLNQQSYHTEGLNRGNANTKDWYAMYGIMITFKPWKESKCPFFQKGKRKR